jgi:mannose-6-phosphate isomerase-like protein (cupin superfamily)
LDEREGEMNKPAVKIIDTEALDKDLEYEPPLIISWSVDQNTTGTKTITTGRTIVPPGGRNQRHYHTNCDAAFFVRKGTIKVFIGEEKKEYIVPENRFVFSPAGGIHGPAEHEPDGHSRGDIYLWQLPEQSGRGHGVPRTTLVALAA